MLIIIRLTHVVGKIVLTDQASYKSFLYTSLLAKDSQQLSLTQNLLQHPTLLFSSPSFRMEDLSSITNEYRLEERMRCAPCWSQGSSHQCVITQDQDEQTCERCTEQSEECLFVLQPRNVMVLRGQVTYQQLVRCSEDDILDLANVPDVDFKALIESSGSDTAATGTDMVDAFNGPQADERLDESRDETVRQPEHGLRTEVEFNSAKSKVEVGNESFVEETAGFRPRKRRREDTEDGST